MPDNFAGPNAIPVTNVAGPSAIPATFFYLWDGLGGFHQNVASPSAIPSVTFFPLDGRGAYHGASVTPSVYFDQYVAATGGGSYAFNNGKSSNYYNYNHLLMDGGSNFSLDANYYTGARLPLGDTTSEMPHQPSQTKIANSGTDEKYNTFKQFDTVGDHSDHLYALQGNGKDSTVKKALFSSRPTNRD
jgi:ubiquitin-conjugating enzyme E2 O